MDFIYYCLTNEKFDLLMFVIYEIFGLFFMSIMHIYSNVLTFLIILSAEKWFIGFWKKFFRGKMNENSKDVKETFTQNITKEIRMKIFKIFYKSTHWNWISCWIHNKPQFLKLLTNSLKIFLNPPTFTFTGTYILLWRRGSSVLTAANLMVTRDTRFKLVDGYNLQIANIRIQDAGKLLTHKKFF